jgi:hypothetical protein
LSTLTKISVVVLVVLVCVVSAIFITQASIVPNYRQAYDSEVLKNNIYQSQLQVANQATAAANFDCDKIKDKLAGVMDKGNDAKSKADDALKAALETNGKLTAINDSQKAQLVNLTSNAAQQDDLLKDAFARLEAARSANEKLTKEYARVEDLLKQAESRSASMESRKKFDDEQIQELREQIKDLQARVASGGAAAAKPGETAVVPEGDAVISGTITAVRDDMASINIGSARGVKTGMKFTVYRPGGQYVGTLQVQGEVGLDSAAGVIVLRRLDAVQGDKVTTKLVN